MSSRWEGGASKSTTSSQVDGATRHLVLGNPQGNLMPKMERNKVIVFWKVCHVAINV